ncbi:MAG: pyruvate ferredoxin oxidoreductase [Candidatus Hodarchaeales archaeon]|jgi:pyruvate ferredoxin oxidoreductase alpha subunit
MTRKFIEGSQGIAEVVAKCKPKVISAYPITPQTHIVEGLAKLVADGELNASFINVEAEFSAASVVQGASARGVRVYSSTASQGLLLMLEVLFCIAGNRLPVCMTIANRSVSSPLSIWNDHQDSMTARDSGWMQFYAETNQEAVDLQLQAFRISEDHRVLLPSFTCIDGYILSHNYESVDIPDQNQVDSFLPQFEPLYRLDPAKPLAFGGMAEPRFYQETRMALSNALNNAIPVIEEIGRKFEEVFGRPGIRLVEKYKLDDAETVIVALGSVCGTIKETIDLMRDAGEKVGLLRIIVFRPLPKEAITSALVGIKNVIVFEKSIVLGVGGPLSLEIRSAFCDVSVKPRISDAIGGLGGRDISHETIKNLLLRASKEQFSNEWVDVNPQVEVEEIS